MGLFYGLTNPACALNYGSAPGLNHDYIWGAVSYDNPANAMLLSTDGISWNLYNSANTDGWNYPYYSFNPTTKEIIKLNFGSNTIGTTYYYSLINETAGTTSMGSNKFGSSSGNPQNLQSTSYWSHWANGRNTWMSTYPGYNSTYSRKVYRNNGTHFNQSTGNNYSKLSYSASSFPYIVIDAPGGDLIIYSRYYDFGSMTGYFYTLPVSTYISGTYVNNFNGFAAASPTTVADKHYIYGCCYMENINKFITVVDGGVVLYDFSTDTFTGSQVALFNDIYSASLEFGNMQ